MIKKGFKIQRNYHCGRQDYDSPNGLMVFGLDSPGDYSTGLGQLGECATAALYVAWGFHATHYNLHLCVCVCVCVCKKKRDNLTYSMLQVKLANATLKQRLQHTMELQETFDSIVEHLNDAHATVRQEGGL